MILGAVVGLPLLVCLGCCVDLTCLPYAVQYGLWNGRCPANPPKLALQASAYGLLRGQAGSVDVRPVARILMGSGLGTWVDEETLYRGVGVDLVLEDPDGKPVPGFVVTDWDGWVAAVAVPQVADGDYTLRVKGTSGLGDAEVEVPLPLYTPALVHLMTDRPLYKPGQDVLLRTVMFRRTDLAPIENRPGRWRIYSPTGEEMMVEKDRSGVMGVADSSFPLDDNAMVGAWRAVWESAGARAETTFDVRPFKLPRLSVTAEPSAPWYGIGDRVALSGTARYTSGAPVANAPVTLRISRTEGRWPQPLAWNEPIQVRTDAAGRFRAEVGVVPDDLIERASFAATLSVTEEAGETVTGSASFVLSELPLSVDAVTEFRGNDGTPSGLAASFNNRAYLRVTSPDGAPLTETKIEVRPWWDPSHAPYVATTDADGVASLQIDPGDPVPVVIPAPPYRPQPLVPQIPTTTEAEDLVDGTLDLDDRRALDRLVLAIRDCGDLTVGGEQVSLGVRVRNGGVDAVSTASDTPVARCVAGAVRRLRMGGGTRTLRLGWSVPDSVRPYFDWSHGVAAGDSAETAISEAGLRARACLPRGRGRDGADLFSVHWRVNAESRAVDASVVRSDESSGLSAAEEACLSRALSGIQLATPAHGDGVGVSIATLRVPSAGGAPEQDRTVNAYKLRVSAGEGATKRDGAIVLAPGEVPPLRIRASNALAKPGDKLTFEFLRGPSFSGGMPDRIWLQKGAVSVSEGTFDAKTRTVEYTLPVDADGLYHLDWNGARSVVFVRPEAKFLVDLTPDRAEYRPGEVAKLGVRTHAGDKGVPAGVGLVGVDSSLAQLAPLPGADAYGATTVRATADAPAFGLFGPASLLLGQISGDQAAMAAVLRISQIPMDAAGDEYTSASGQSVNRDLEILTDGFYRALAHAAKRVADWEKSASAEDRLTNEKMAAIWTDAIADCKAEGKPAVDVFDRPLTLDVLPYDLLAQVDPRNLVSDATRLPEDVVAWQGWVDAEVRR